jgi:hypothetical protein
MGGRGLAVNCFVTGRKGISYAVQRAVRTAGKLGSTDVEHSVTFG